MNPYESPRGIDMPPRRTAERVWFVVMIGTYAAMLLSFAVAAATVHVWGLAATAGLGLLNMLSQHMHSKSRGIRVRERFP